MITNLDNLRDKHEDKRIAILGSAPSIELYRGEEDFAIAVNGSVMCPSVIKNGADYFLCGDKMSPNRRWFNSSREICKKRIVANFIAPYDMDIIKSSDERYRLQQIIKSDLIHLSQKGGNIHLNLDFSEINFPHIVFNYADIWEQEISKNQQRLCRGGTISGVGVQLAMIMGASEIHLYGCQFGVKNKTQAHYGYNNNGELGGIAEFHPIRMDYILSEISTRYPSIKIFSHGFTKLRVPENILS